VLRDVRCDRGLVLHLQKVPKSDQDEDAVR
jgi:hypothetical protein